MRAPYVATAFIIFACYLQAQKASETPSHGTINVLLATKEGIVLATDSRASNEGRLVNDRSRKLFQLDSSTFCSIAGFGSDPGPDRQLRTSAGGIIRAFAEELANEKQVSFEQKVFILTRMMGMRLESLEEEYRSATKPRQPKDDQIIMLFAGRDSDGTLKAARVEILVDPPNDITGKSDFRMRIPEYKIHEIHDGDFLPLTSGIDDSAQLRLKYPEAYKDESELSDYRDATARKDAGNLKLSQLQRLAHYLVVEAYTVPVVGGPVQMATLATNGATQLDAPPDLLPDPKPYSTALIRGLVLENPPTMPPAHPPGVHTLPHSVFINATCSNSGFILDYSIMIGGTFNACTFYYDGGDVYRDPSVIVNGGQLILGPHASPDSYSAQKMREQFPELKIIASYKELSDPETVRSLVWPSRNEQN